MNKTITGIGFLNAGMIGLGHQQITEAIFSTSGNTFEYGIMHFISILFLILGIVFIILGLIKKDKNI